MWRKLSCFLTLCLSAAACSNTYVLSDSVIQAGIGPALPGTFVELDACGACVFGEPDQVFAVPPNFAQINFYRLNSPDGGYYHKPGNCDCFVGEVWMYFNSNKQPYPNGNPEHVIVSGGGFDTPSSSSYGATVPTNQEDCERYYRATRIWLKEEGTDTWVQQKKEVATGSWSPAGSGSCQVSTGTNMSHNPSTTNQARRLRVAVKILVRETAQKAAVETSLPPPQ